MRQERARCDICPWVSRWSGRVTGMWHTAVMHQMREHPNREHPNGWASIDNRDRSGWVEARHRP